jgi:hypothetical protein
MVGRGENEESRKRGDDDFERKQDERSDVPTNSDIRTPTSEFEPSVDDPRGAS